ncbi:hypothetical protein [Candidatus Palauibacter sp.]|uniref:hypothetical protein n=1 Tax=Candidatus Palauibacter sp. TaxID=3101350 RepID=UPI003C7014FD
MPMVTSSHDGFSDGFNGIGHRKCGNINLRFWTGEVGVVATCFLNQHDAEYDQNSNHPTQRPEPPSRNISLLLHRTTPALK